MTSIAFTRTAVIAGVGPGVGAALAKAFHKEGYHIALLSRSQDFTSTLAKELSNQSSSASATTATAFSCDLAQDTSIQAAMTSIQKECPPVEVLVFNAGGYGTFKPGSILDINGDDLHQGIRAATIGPLTVAKSLLPGMIKNNKGSVFFTGATASTRGSANYAFIAVPKFATKALAESMAREMGPKGIHVSHIILDGVVFSERARAWKPDAKDEDFLHPEQIAAQYVTLHKQPKSAWTYELVLRPAAEKW